MHHPFGLDRQNLFISISLILTENLQATYVFYLVAESEIEIGHAVGRSWGHGTLYYHAEQLGSVNFWNVFSMI